MHNNLIETDYYWETASYKQGILNKKNMWLDINQTF